MNDENFETNFTDDETVINDTEVFEQEESTFSDSSFNAYVDTFYSEVLNDLENIQSQQQILINSQNTIIEQQQQEQAILNTHTTYFECILFLIAAIYVTQIIRNMIRKV